MPAWCSLRRIIPRNPMRPRFDRSDPKRVTWVGFCVTKLNSLLRFDPNTRRLAVTEKLKTHHVGVAADGAVFEVLLLAAAVAFADPKAPATSRGSTSPLLPRIDQST